MKFKPNLPKLTNFYVLGGNQCSNLFLKGLSEFEFYGDLVYKFRKIVGRNDFSNQFRKIIIHHKRIGYNKNVMRQTACLVVNQTTVNNFTALFLIARLRVGPQT